MSASSQRTNPYLAPTMQRAVAEAFALDAAESEREHPFHDDYQWREGQDDYEQQIARQWGEA